MARRRRRNFVEPVSAMALASAVVGAAGAIFGGVAAGKQSEAALKAQNIANKAQQQIAQYGVYQQAQQQQFEAEQAAARTKTIVLYSIGGAALAIAGFFVYKALKKRG